MLRTFPSFPRIARSRALSRSFSELAAPREAITRADEIISRTSFLFIDNQYVEAEAGRLPVLSPIDGKPFASISHASAKDVDKAVQAARRCFDKDGWAQQDVKARAEILKRIAASLRTPEVSDALCVIESRDCGKPFSESQGDLGVCADTFDYYAEVAPQVMKTNHDISTGSAEFYARIENEPLGVVGCITPWNFPLMQAVLKVAPALAAGCSVVLKPSPLASLTCCALGELVAAAGAPPGALNVITGGPPEALEGGGSSGQYLIDHELLDKVSFTGSGMAGQKMLEASASKLRPTCLELGGKSAFIIFDDADGEGGLDSVVDWVMVGIFQCTGQVCSATSRVLVHESLEQKLVDRLLERVRNIKVGDPLAAGTLMGPLVSEGQKQKVLGMIKQAENDGAKNHALPLQLSSDLEQGYYVPPTILSNLPFESKAWKEEIFGPVLAIRSFRTEEEAIQLANDTPYGLANAVYSSDRRRCQRVASQLKSGVVWENCSQVLFPSTPFGGRQGRASGFGFEQGLSGLKEFLSEKTVISNDRTTFDWGIYKQA